MEEDVEIERLWKSNKSVLKEAAKLVSKENFIEDEETNILVKDVNNTNMNEISTEGTSLVLKNHTEFSQPQPSCSNICYVDAEPNINFGEEVQGLLDDQMVSYVAKEPTRHLLPLHSIDSEGESSLSEGDCDGNYKSLGLDDYKGSENVIGQTQKLVNSKSKQSLQKTLHDLNPIQRLILEKERLLTILEMKLQEELHENEEKQRKIRNTIMRLHTNSTASKEPSFNRCFFKKFGMPYFEDSNGFAPLPNNDYKKKLENGELVVTLVPKVHYWVRSHKEMLQDAIRQTIIEEHSEKIRKEIIKLKGGSATPLIQKDYEEIGEKISELQAELCAVKTASYSELVSKEECDREYDWMKYSATVFNGGHSTEECRRFWHVYLKPSINKANWEMHEDLKLLEVAEQMQHQDWDTIAKLLNTNRTAYQCFVHFQTRIRTKHEYSSGKWSKEEDKKLLSVINASKIGDFIPWNKVSTHIGSRNHNQIYNRWSNCLNPKLVKGRFTKEEDLLIVSGIEVFGVNFKEMSSLMNSRTPTQIRERYERHLLPKTAKVGSWSLDEDEKLLSLIQKHGEQNWASISKDMKTRSRTQVRQRYNFIQRMMKTKPGWNITQTRRKNIHIVKKELKITQKSVDKVKKEIAVVDKFFNLSKLEKDTFRIEKLKELRNQILMKKFDLKQKRKFFSPNSDVNIELLEYFKNSHTVPCIKSTKITNPNDCKSYLNEILLMAKYFGHDLHFPETEDEIKDNLKLRFNLKHFLCEINGKIEGPVKSLLEGPSSSTSILNDYSNIDYKEPDIKHDIIMKDCWHSPPFDIRCLNFSELFKRTVFDYSNGIHKDIWDSRNKRPSILHSTCSDVVPEPEQSPYNQQSFHIPPNHLTSLGLRSLLLSRTRLKRDASKKESKENLVIMPEEEIVKSDIDLNHKLLDQFQETMITLFTWPKVLSFTSIDSTPVVQVSKANVCYPHARIRNSKKRQNDIVMSHLIHQTPENETDGSSKVSNSQNKKLWKTIQDQREDRKQLLEEIRKGMNYKKKVNIEHLLKKKDVMKKNIKQEKKKSSKSSCKKVGRPSRKASDIDVNHGCRKKCAKEQESSNSNHITNETENIMYIQKSNLTYRKNKQTNKRTKHFEDTCEPAAKKIRNRNKLSRNTKENNSSDDIPFIRNQTLVSTSNGVCKLSESETIDKFTDQQDSFEVEYCLEMIPEDAV